MNNEILILMRSVEATGRHKHAKDGLIARTPGVEPEEAGKRVEAYATSIAIEILDRIENVIAEFGEDPIKCAPILGEQIAAIRNALQAGSSNADPDL